MAGSSCEDTLVAHLTEVEMFEEPGRLQVRKSGDVTPAEVLSELAGSVARGARVIAGGPTYCLRHFHGNRR